jgi:hypothetical protein
MHTARVVAVAALLSAFGSAASAEEPPSLAKARTLYNAANYEGAIDAASVARTDAAWTDAAALVIARSYLERYRLQADAEDLGAARDALNAVRSTSLTPRDYVDYIVGLGLSLYLGESYGAAAELFDTALSRASLLPQHDQLLLLDWWATALDREGQIRSSDSRPAVFARIAARMEEEIRREPGNAVANYWIAVAARGRGDIDGAWNYAVAAWVRSRLSTDVEKLRVDLDRLMTQALIPERARTIVAREPQEGLAALRTEWEILKQQWK